MFTLNVQSPHINYESQEKGEKNKQKIMQIWRTICRRMFSPMGLPQPCEIHNPSLREDDIWLPPLSTVTLCLWSFCFFRRASG